MKRSQTTHVFALCAFAGMLTVGCGGKISNGGTPPPVLDNGTTTSRSGSDGSIQEPKTDDSPPEQESAAEKAAADKATADKATADKATAGKAVADKAAADKAAADKAAADKAAADKAAADKAAADKVAADKAAAEDAKLSVTFTTGFSVTGDNRQWLVRDKYLRTASQLTISSKREDYLKLKSCYVHSNFFFSGNLAINPGEGTASEVKVQTMPIQLADLPSGLSLFRTFDVSLLCAKLDGTTYTNTTTFVMGDMNMCIFSSRGYSLPQNGVPRCLPNSLAIVSGTIADILKISSVRIKAVEAVPAPSGLNNVLTLTPSQTSAHVEIEAQLPAKKDDHGVITTLVDTATCGWLRANSSKNIVYSNPITLTPTTVLNILPVNVTDIRASTTIKAYCRIHRSDEDTVDYVFSDNLNIKPSP